MTRQTFSIRVVESKQASNRAALRPRIQGSAQVDVADKGTDLVATDDRKIVP
jgi:hypothetical protein